MSENDNIFEKISVLNKLNEEIKRNIKLLYVFKDFLNGNNVILVTNEDKVYCFGYNGRRVLGFGHDKSIKEFIINEELSDKQIIAFKSNQSHTFARDSDGKLYYWGHYRYLGSGRYDFDISKPELNKYLINENIIDMCCGYRHTLVLTSNNEVYGWGENNWGQIGNSSNGVYVSIPFKLEEFNDEKVTAISCGFYYSMALTESGSVYSWGNNYWGQLGLNNENKYENKPKLIPIKIKIEKISCGNYHSLLLSRDGNIYVFGNNELGQCGGLRPKKRKTPYKLITENKFIDIATHYEYNISIALSEKQNVFIWGECGEEVIEKPFETQFKTFHEVFLNYYQITSKTLDFSRNTGNGRYNYEFNEMTLIAIGSFGIVCKAVEKKNNKIFAVKKIPIEKKFEEKALKEIEIMPKLKSDFIVRLESVWIEDNYLKADDFKEAENSSDILRTEVFKPDKSLLLHIQMELCLMTLKYAMKQLNQKLNQKTSEVMTTLGYFISSELFIEILESVDYLHKQNVIHRDLKPNNILINGGKNGRFVKIADFGLATIHEFEGQSHTKYKGTVRYAAPEVMRTRKYDTKADIFSLGVIIQELFNIDINEQIGEESELKNKYSAIFDLIDRMTSNQKIKRPDCETILKEKDLWTLSSDEFEIKYKKRKSCEDLKSFYLNSILLSNEQEENI